MLALPIGSTSSRFACGRGITCTDTSSPTRRAAAAPQTGTFHRRERAAGEFSHTVVLPYEVDAENVQASLVDGVLKLTLPKSAAAKPRKINVNQPVHVNQSEKQS